MATDPTREHQPPAPHRRAIYQRAFDTAAQGVLAQGRRATGTDPIDGRSWCCLLRVPLDGTRCNLGQLIGTYTPDLERLGPDDLAILGVLGPEFTAEDAPFLDDLRTAHDEPALNAPWDGFIRAYQLSMIKLAAKWELDARAVQP